MVKLLSDITCYDFRFILRILGYILWAMKFIVPIVLIVLIIIDMAKIVITGDEKSKKEGVERSVKRFIYAIVLFLIPLAVQLIFNVVSKTSVKDVYGGEVESSWSDCFKKYVINRE